MAITDVLKGLVEKASIARQFFVWNVLGSVVSAEIDPFVQELRNRANARTPVIPLSPADVADMTVRGVVGADFATSEGAKSGYSANLMKLLVENTGEAPALDEMLLLHRKGEATDDELVRAIKQSRLKDEWIPLALKMGLLPPSGPEVVDALIKNRVATDEAKKRWAESGSDPTWFDTAVLAAGSAPSPDQAAAMARRGVIPKDSPTSGGVSFAQAVAEGHWNTKWADAFWAFSEYRPPPRTITAMHNSGALSTTEATTLLLQAGVSSDLVGAYLADSSATKTSKYKALAEATVQALWTDQAIDDATATTMLEQLKYDTAEAAFILSVWQNQRDQKAITTAIGTVHTAYINRRIDRPTASGSLDALGVPSNQRDGLLSTWDIEQVDKVTLLTAAEIAKAAKLGVISTDDATARLEQHGYTPTDAQIYLIIQGALNAPTATG